MSFPTEEPDSLHTVDIRHMVLKRLNVLAGAHVPHIGFLITSLKKKNIKMHKEENIRSLKQQQNVFSQKKPQKNFNFFSPRRQKCFLSRRGRGPETGRRLCDRGNFAAAVRSPHPTKHTCRPRCRSGSNANAHVTQARGEDNSNCTVWNQTDRNMWRNNYPLTSERHWELRAGVLVGFNVTLLLSNLYLEIGMRK